MVRAVFHRLRGEGCKERKYEYPQVELQRWGGKRWRGRRTSAVQKARGPEGWKAGELWRRGFASLQWRGVRRKRGAAQQPPADDCQYRQQEDGNTCGYIKNTAMGDVATEEFQSRAKEVVTAATIIAAA